ncbi:hypothetical protein FQA39_LY16588 [Lamprigera yunnana]|nr:hypothetical protein FQA39_LY16588 [Lamprigera yunnana]
MATDITTNSEAHASNAGTPSLAYDNDITHGTPTTQPLIVTGMSVTNNKTHYSDKSDNFKIKNKAKPPSAIKRNKERAIKYREKKSQQLETKNTSDNFKIKNKAKPPSANKRNKERAIKYREKKSQQLETKNTSDKTTQTAKPSKNVITKIWQRLIICRTRNIDQGDDSYVVEIKETEVTQKEPVIPNNHTSKDPTNVNNTHVNISKQNDIANQKQVDPTTKVPVPNKATLRV